MPFVIAGLDPAIHAAENSVWTTGSSPVVTRKRSGAIAEIAGGLTASPIELAGLGVARSFRQRDVRRLGPPARPKAALFRLVRYVGFQFVMQPFGVGENVDDC
ncbi:MAG: hypothetical protein WCA56_24140 [Xanthobacteraceae bacterium]